MTDKEAKHFYNSKAWKDKRIIILERDHHECQDCIERLHKAVECGRFLSAEERKIRQATEVHHIKELKEFPELGLDDENLTSLCSMCHNLRHGRTVKQFVKKKKPVTQERW